MKTKIIVLGHGSKEDLVISVRGDTSGHLVNQREVYNREAVLLVEELYKHLPQALLDQIGMSIAQKKKWNEMIAHRGKEQDSNDERGLSFEQRVIAQALELDESTGLDNRRLSALDWQTCIKILADIYTAIGIKMPDDWV